MFDGHFLMACGISKKSAGRTLCNWEIPPDARHKDIDTVMLPNSVCLNCRVAYREITNLPQEQPTRRTWRQREAETELER